MKLIDYRQRLPRVKAIFLTEKNLAEVEEALRGNRDTKPDFSGYVGAWFVQHSGSEAWEIMTDDYFRERWVEVD